jgi:SAM-dependent methyltransferase
LRQRTLGTPDPLVFEKTGHGLATHLIAALAEHGQPLEDFKKILEVDAGCAVLLRWLRQLVPQSQLAATDSDPETIQWLNSTLPDIEARLHKAQAPLPFTTQTFDLTLSRHLPEPFTPEPAQAWFRELARLTQPGGWLALLVGNQNLTAVQGLSHPWFALVDSPALADGPVTMSLLRRTNTL